MSGKIAMKKKKCQLVYKLIDTSNINFLLNNL